MTEGRTTEPAWRELVHQVYPDARPEEFEVRPSGAIFFRLVGEPEGLHAGYYRAAWFPAHSYGYVEVGRG